MKPYIYLDVRNREALEAAKKFKHHDMHDADVVLVLGGDGTMIKAIHDLESLDLPFYGINYGHVGFLLNETRGIPDDPITHELPFLYVEWLEPTGEKCIDENGKEDEIICIPGAIAVNDVWVERATPQTASMRVRIDLTERFSKIHADGLLISSPAGSTAYARSMGGTPLPLHTNVIQLVGNNVSYPMWKSALLDMKQKVRIENLDPDKRPINLFADGRLLRKDVRELTIGTHPKKKFRLLFDKSNNLAEKIAKVQFPK